MKTLKQKVKDFIKSITRFFAEDPRKGKIKNARYRAALMVANEGKIGAEMIASEHLQYAEGPHVEFSQMINEAIKEIPHNAAIKLEPSKKQAFVNDILFNV